MITQEEIIKGGVIVKAHGLNGELNVFSEYPLEMYEEGMPLIIDLDGLYVPFFVTAIRGRKTFGGIVSLEDVDSKEEAEIFAGRNYYLRRTWVAEKLEVEVDEIEQEAEFVGYTLKDVNYGVIGTIADIDDSNANILMKVLTEDENGEEKEILLPLHDDFIVVVDDENKIMETQLPEGCLDLN